MSNYIAYNRFLNVILYIYYHYYAAFKVPYVSHRRRITGASYVNVYKKNTVFSFRLKVRRGNVQIAAGNMVQKTVPNTWRTCEKL